ncbi:uncharacterized protein [Typha latifolia]
MALLSRRLPLLARFLSTSTTTSAAADRFLHLLQSPSSNPTLELALSSSTLTPSIITSVLLRSPSRLLALRFFLSAAQHCRLSAASFSSAAAALDLRRQPQTLTLLLDSYSSSSSARVTTFAFNTLLRLCRHANLADEALAVLRRMPDFSCRPDTFSYNAVVQLLADSGRGDAGMDLLDEMVIAGVSPNMVTFVTVVRGLAVLGMIDSARGVVLRMRNHGCMPNVVVYSALLDGICGFGNLDAAMELLREMEEGLDGECVPNVVTYTCLVKCLCEKAQLEGALAILDRMGGRGVMPNRVFVRTLVNGFCANGDVDRAYELVERVVGEESISSNECYSLLVVCLLRAGNLEHAEGLVRRMLENGVKPDGLASNCMMRELCLRGRFSDGYCWLGVMEDNGATCIDSDVYSRLLTGLCEEGYFLEASMLGRKIVKMGVRMESSCVDLVVSMLRKFGEGDLASEIMRLKELQ